MIYTDVNDKYQLTDITNQVVIRGCNLEEYPIDIHTDVAYTTGKYIGGTCQWTLYAEDIDTVKYFSHFFHHNIKLDLLLDNFTKHMQYLFKTCSVMDIQKIPQVWWYTGVERDKVALHEKWQITFSSDTPEFTYKTH